MRERLHYTYDGFLYCVSADLLVSRINSKYWPRQQMMYFLMTWRNSIGLINVYGSSDSVNEKHTDSCMLGPWALTLARLQFPAANINDSHNTAFLHFSKNKFFWLLAKLRGTFNLLFYSEIVDFPVFKHLKNLKIYIFVLKYIKIIF